MQIWGCQKAKIPEPINIKFGVGDDVGHVTPNA